MERPQDIREWRAQIAERFPALADYAELVVLDEGERHNPPPPFAEEGEPTEEEEVER